jgi:hypothetical protein
MMVPIRNTSKKYNIPRDHVNRVRFCERLQPRLHILRDIQFTAEAQLSRRVITTTRNSRSWAHMNPRDISECNFQSKYGVDY